jgi:hypothetical protein
MERLAHNTGAFVNGLIVQLKGGGFKAPTFNVRREANYYDVQ